MNRQEKLEYTSDFIRQWHTLQHGPHTVSLLDWIALKWSCTPVEAQRLIDAARKLEVKRTTK